MPLHKKKFNFRREILNPIERDVKGVINEPMQVLKLGAKTFDNATSNLAMPLLLIGGGLIVYYVVYRK